MTARTRVFAVVAALVVLLAIRTWLMSAHGTAPHGWDGVVTDLVHTVRDHGLLGVVTLGIAYIAAMLIFFPANALTVGAGSAYGLVAGVAFVVPVSLLGASIAFGIGRTVGRRWAERRIERHAWFRAIDRALETNGFRIILLMRLALIFPFNVLNYALATTRVRFRDFFLASAIGTVPGTVLYVYAGSLAMTAGELGASIGPWRWALYLGGLAAGALTVWLTVRYARSELARELDRSEARHGVETAPPTRRGARGANERPPASLSEARH